MTKVEIGNATLYCGDCVEILPTLPKVDAVITDPPYGVNLGDNVNSRGPEHGLFKPGYLSYEDTPENFSLIIVPAIKKALSLCDRAAIFCQAPNCWQFPPADQVGGVFLPSARGRSRWGFVSFVSMLLYGCAPDLNLGPKATAWSFTVAADKNGHPCPKPDQWLVRVVDLISRRGELVLDPFMGSGTTGVACMNLGRKFIGIEIEKKYFDIACERIDQVQKQGRLFADEPNLSQSKIAISND